MTTQQQYEILRKELNEQQWRLFLGTEALKIGDGGIGKVAALSGADWKTVQRGVKELRGEIPRAEGRIRKAGGGRKKVVATDPSLQRDLEELLEPKGDPMSLVKWTTRSLAHLVKGLSKQGHTIKKTALAELLHELGYSLKVNKKAMEGVSHPDREWNKIEHRLFSFISINWRAKPLASLETVIELISHTTTKEGLQVTAIKDSNTYPTGITVTDAELNSLNIIRDPFHGEWNYTIKPQDAQAL